MKQLTAAILCIAVLYGLDAVFFSGWYFSNATKAIEKTYSLSW
jgi:hypothetical protein